MASQTGASAAVAAVPRALVLRLYRQLARSATAYARHAQARQLPTSNEMQRLLGVAHRAPPSTVSAGSSTGLAESPSSSALSSQLDHWLKRTPTLFKQLNRKTGATPSLAHTTASAAVTTAAISTTAAPRVSPPSSSPTSSASSASPADSATARTFAALHESTGPRTPVVPTPHWVAASYEAGLEVTPVSEAWLRLLLRAAFRQAASKDLTIATRMSNAFALHKRFVERAGELAFLPLTPLASQCSATIPGIVTVRLRSLGLFKAHRGNYWFQLEWRVQNISNDRTLVLESRTLRTQERTIASTGSKPPTEGKVVPPTHLDLVRRGTPPGLTSSMGTSSAHTSSVTSSALGGPATSASSLASAGGFPFGLHVASHGSGLRGRPVGLPAGSSVERELANIRLDSPLGVLGAELLFMDYSTTPPTERRLTLEPILLDAHAPPNPLEDENTPAYVPPRLRHRDETRELLSGALKIETKGATQTKPDDATTPGKGSDSDSNSKPSP